MILFIQVKYKVEDKYAESPMNVGKMVLSPTRAYAPMMIEILNKYRNQINGIIHCTGGGQTKVMHFIDHIHVVKNNLFDLPPVYKMIQEVSNADLKEMFSVFNMGHRLEIYTSETVAKELIDIARSYNIEAKIIGYCEASERKKLTIKTKNKVLEYN
jgi:phosphoribosylformylglycinamidine cyclo-ligase